MNVWKLTGAGKIEKTESPVPEPEAGKIKVRVTKVLLCNADAEAYLGSTKIKQPMIPGQFAIGMVAEDNANAMFAKGTRVVLHAFVPAPHGRDAGRPGWPRPTAAPRKRTSRRTISTYADNRRTAICGISSISLPTK